MKSDFKKVVNFYTVLKGVKRKRQQSAAFLGRKGT